MGRASKMVVDKLIADMQSRPGDFSIGEHTLIDHRLGYSYWIANGALSTGIYSPYRMDFGIVQGIRFNSALNKFKAWKNLHAERVTA